MSDAGFFVLLWEIKHTEIVHFIIFNEEHLKNIFIVKLLLNSCSAAIVSFDFLSSLYIRNSIF